jgi:ubiquinone/menaquinone biosynthesis C-methylase UbiE
LAQLGRLRALLRLGERPNPSAPRRRVLAAARRRQDGPVLELGCGTGRIAIPVAQAGARIIGIDRSEEMLARARKRIKRARLSTRLSLVRGDITALPFGARTKFSAVLAAYGILQSLTRERDLLRTFDSVARVLKRNGLLRSMSCLICRSGTSIAIGSA